MAERGIKLLTGVGGKVVPHVRVGQASSWFSLSDHSYFKLNALLIQIQMLSG